MDSDVSVYGLKNRYYKFTQINIKFTTNMEGQI